MRLTSPLYLYVLLVVFVFLFICYTFRVCLFLDGCCIEIAIRCYLIGTIAVHIPENVVLFFVCLFNGVYFIFRLLDVCAVFYVAVYLPLLLLPLHLQHFPARYLFVPLLFCTWCISNLSDLNSISSFLIISAISARIDHVCYRSSPLLCHRLIYYVGIVFSLLCVGKPNL